MNLRIKNTIQLIPLFILCTCAHATEPSSVVKPDTKAPEARAKGYGDFLFIPPSSMVIKNFVDRDDDRIDDRYQLQPGGKGFPLGHFYKNP